MGGDTVFFQKFAQIIGHFVVDRALADDRAFLQPVESGCVVFIRDDHKVGIFRREDFFCFAFIKLFFLFHIGLPP